MYIGIALIALPKAVSEVGFFAAAFGLVLVNMISLGASYFLLKARNRFKKQRIIDFPDMANACFGPTTKRFCEWILILTNTTFAMAQAMYLGGQADLFACAWTEQPDQCGKNRTFWSFAMIALMIPLFLIPDFKRISAFSGFFILCCVVSIICIFGFEIATLYAREHGEEMHLTYSDDTGKVLIASEAVLDTAFDYEYFNYPMFPLFLGEVLSVFEGNVGLLNLYSQQNEPRTMMKQTALTHIIVLALCLAMGSLSYLSYGSLTQDIVLFNLPQGSNVATFVALLYMLNVTGSIMMQIQPIY